MTAPEIAGGAAPGLFRTGVKREIVSNIAGDGGERIFTQLGAGWLLPEALGQEAIVEIFLPVVGIFAFAGPAEKVVCQPHHVVDGAVPVSYTHLDVYKRQR